MNLLHDDITSANHHDLKQRYLHQFCLSDVFSADTIKKLRLIKFDPYQYLCHQGDELQAIYFLVQGKLQTDHIHKNGQQAVFSIEKPFSIIGDLELLNQQPVIANVKAIQPSRLLMLDIGYVLSALVDDIDFLKFLNQYLTKKLLFASKLLAQATLPFNAKVVRYLLYRFDLDGNLLTLENRETIATMLGGSVRHLNRTLKNLKESGAISLKAKTLSIIDIEYLRAISE